MAGYIGSKASVVSSGAERKKTFTITGATTSLTGLNYTVGKVHVFQNGVRLVDGTDYTATNGTTITLTVAAQNGDNVVVISQADFQVADALLTSGGTMTGDLTVQGAFTSQGIDDNGNATAMTIDGNEGVNIGKTSAALGTVGLQLSSTGYSAITTNHNTDTEAPLRLNKLNGEGSLLRLYKDSSEVGSIGVYSSDNLYLQGKSDHSGLAFGQAEIYGFRGGSENDGVTSLGSSGARWKDAYLSGGVYLGGTGSDNKLSDYEIGTWTPTLPNGGTVGTILRLHILKLVT